MRYAISGSRGPDPERGRQTGWTDAALVARIVSRLLEQGHTINVGDAPSGVDLDVRRVSPLKSTTVFKANWAKEGKAAGVKRNGRMLEQSDALIALFADGPPTPGTRNAVKQAREAGMPVYIYHEGQWDVPNA